MAAVLIVRLTNEDSEELTYDHCRENGYGNQQVLEA